MLVVRFAEMLVVVRSSGPEFENTPCSPMRLEFEIRGLAG